MKEILRDARSFGWLEDARRDCGYALRTLGRTPGFTAVAVLTLALGIGSVTIIYSVVHNVLLDPLPYPDADRLVNVVVQDTATARQRPVFSAPELLDFKEASTSFEDVIGTLGVNMMYTDRERAEYLRGVWVTPNFFEFMGLAPAIGRTIDAADARPDAPPVAVLRHRAWVNYFGANPDVVGRTIVLNGEPFTVVGVMPPRFTWHAADVWIPKPIDPAAPDARATIRNFQARLRRGVSLEAAETELNLIAARRARQHPGDYPERFRIQVLNVIAYTVGAFSGVLYTTLAAVALLLLIACCNVANMLLARATVREREMTVRAALGASRGRIVRQLLVESLLLGLSGAAIGCVLASAGLDLLVALLPQNPLPGEVQIALDGAALMVSLGAAIVSALLFGTAPALYSARKDLVDGLKAGGRAVAGGRGRLRNALVVAEIALSLVLLLGAGLLVRTFVSIVRVDLGFDPARILVVPVAFAPGAYTAPTDRQQFYDRALQRIAVLPGVDAVSATTYIPPHEWGQRSDVEIAGSAASATRPWAFVQMCTEDYFRTLGIQILRGRGLSARTVDAEAAVVNRTLASSFFGTADPLGEHITVSSPMTGDRQLEIVGVVEDVRNQGLVQPPAPQVYVYGAGPIRGTPFILVRTARDPASVLSAVRSEIAAVDRHVALRQPETLHQQLQRGFYAQPRFSVVVLTVFAATGTLLVAVGVFSVMAYTVSQRTKEIAVRMALGADRRDVVGVVLRAAATLLAAGAAIGLAAHAATSRLIANQLWNTSPQDPLTLAAATSLIAAVALAASYLPARRAMRVDPTAVLRHD